jgi:CHAD domain-containing protein
MSEGKWFTDVAPDTPLADAAQRVLTHRLELVGKYLEAVARAGTEEPEDIHQLRVSSRRATAGLDLFAGCFPFKVQRKAKKELKRLRRAAGTARDWDVFLDSLKSRAMPAKARPSLDLLSGYAFGQRQAARIQLISAAQQYAEDFPQFAQHVVASIHRHGHHVHLQRLASLPPTALFPLIRALDEAAGRDLTDSDNLHQVRIAGKRLRYGMEILAPCFTSPFCEKLYPAVEDLQEILGRANDSRSAIARLEELRGQIEKTQPTGWKKKLAALAEFCLYHQRRMTQERRRFERWYKVWNKSGGEPAFHSCLATNHTPHPASLTNSQPAPQPAAPAPESVGEPP